MQAYKEANDVVAWAQAVRCKGQRIKEVWNYPLGPIPFPYVLVSMLGLVKCGIRICYQFVNRNVLPLSRTESVGMFCSPISLPTFAESTVSVVEHLKKLGWDDELSRMANSDPKPQDQAEVSKICRKEITDQGTPFIEHHVHDHLIWGSPVVLGHLPQRVHAEGPRQTISQ